MLYEATIIFHVKQALIKVSGEIDIPLEVQNKLHVSLTHQKLVFYTSNEGAICSTNLSPCYFSLVSPTECQLTHKKPEDTKTPTNIDPIVVLTIRSAEQFIAQIKAKCSNSKYKSCLSFTPSESQQASILASESPSPKFRGIINLFVIMFIALNLRNIYENFVFYGLKFIEYPYQMMNLSTVACLILELLFVELSYRVNLLRFHHLLPDKVVKCLLILSQIGLLVFIAVFCRTYLSGSFIQAIIVTFIGLMLFMKLVSYMQVNSELFTLLQQSTKLSKQEFNEYVFANHEISDQNLKLILQYRSNWQELVSREKLAYFVIAPTLCYQLIYPRSKSIRYGWLFKRVVQLIVMSALHLVIMVQYLDPQLQSWFNLNKQETGFFETANHLIRFAIPYIIWWILGSYILFHLYMNILAQLIRFADRKFYMDWWNCHNLDEYWKTWNLPVHNFMVRHCYIPVRKMGISKYGANLIVFALSGVLHEYLADVPLGVLSYWAFLAMLLQNPAVQLERYISYKFNLQNSELGNVSFWIAFCFLGQPTCLFIYYSLYVKSHIQ